MPAIGDIYRVVAKGRIANAVEWRGMFAYHLTSANATEDEIAQALEDKIASMYATIFGVLSNQLTLYETETQKWHPAAGGNPGYWLGYHSSLRSHTGSIATDITGFQPAILVLLKTAVKKVLGRKFIPGLAEAYTAAGLLTSPMVTAAATFAADMLDVVVAGAGGGAAPGVLMKDGTFTEYLSTTVGSIISSMRRRKPGYGI